MQQIINIRSGIERSEYTKIIHSLLKKNIEIRSKAVVTFLHKKGFNI